MNIEIDHDMVDKIVVQALTEDYDCCYRELDEDGDVYHDDELMLHLKAAIFYYLTSVEQKAFNERFPLCP